MECRVLSLVAPGACGVEDDGLTSMASGINHLEMKVQSYLIRVADSILQQALYCSCLAPFEVNTVSSCGIEGQRDRVLFDGFVVCLRVCCSITHALERRYTSSGKL